MSGVGAVTAAVSTSGTSGDAPLLDPATGKTLLPPPSLGDEQLDAMALLYLMQTKMREQGMNDGKAAIQVKHADIKEALRKEHEALQQAIEQSKKGSFWDDFGKVALTVAKVAAVAGSIALAVGTCGAGTAVAALAIAGAVMSTAGFVEGEFQVLEKFGVDATTAGWIGFGLSLGGAASSLGAGLVSTGAAAGDAADTAASAGQASAQGSQGTAATAGAGQIGTKGSSITTAFSTAGKVATVAAGCAAIAGGAAQIVASNAHADELNAAATALHEQMKAQWLQRQILALIDALKDSDESDARVLDGIRGVMMTKGDTLVASSMRV